MKKLLVRILFGIGAVIGLLMVASSVLLAVFWEEAKVRGSNLVAIFEEPEYAEGFKNREEVLEYLKAHPENFSLVGYTTSEDSSAPSIEYLPEEPTPLASTKKIVVLAAYAREVSEGNLDPDEEIPVSEWEKYYLPNTDGGAHSEALRELDIATEENGAASKPEAEVRLSEVAGAMTSESDNAATDYLIERLGEEKIQAVIEGENLEGHEHIVPLLGSTLLWFDLESEDPDLSKQLSGERLEELRKLDKEEYTARVRELTKAYAAGEIGARWHENGPPLGDLRYQRDVAGAFETKGSAGDYARIMERVSSGEFISPEVSEVMRRHLDWPMESGRNKERFDTLGAKGGSLSGVLNQAVYAVPKSGGFSGETRIVVLFTRDMSASAWLGAQQSEGYDEFVNAVATDKEFVEKVKRETGKETSSDGS